MRVLHVNLLLAVCLALAVMANTAHASPVAAHAMVHTCCMSPALKERIFSEAKELGASRIRVDVELEGIFGGASAPDWSGLDEVIELSEKYDLPVLGILIVPRTYADADEFGTRSAAIAERAEATIRDWEVLNEPDGDWAWNGTPEEYAAMLSAAHDGIKASVPGARIVFGGLMRPNQTRWLERVLATPGADALRKFDVANVHLRGPADAVVRRYTEFRSWLAARGFTGPVWVTEHGYPADPAFQVDGAFAGGAPGQAAYLTQTLVGLGEAGAEQVFVTLRDNLEGEYASEGVTHIAGPPAHAATRRESFAAVSRLASSWDQVMAWRREQRVAEQSVRVQLAAASISAGETRTARAKFRQARLLVHAVQEELARPRLSEKARARITRRLARIRAMVAGRRTALLWHTSLTDYRRARAFEHAAAAYLLRERIAGR